MDYAYLREDFEPAKATSAALREIFIDREVPYSSAARKADLVTIFEERIRPNVARWRRERERVRASSAGIEDHRGPANDGDDDDDFVEQAPAAPAPKKRGRPPKSASMNNLASVSNAATATKPSRRSSALTSSASTTSLATSSRRTGMRRSASVEIIQDSQDDEDERAFEGDSDVPVSAPTMPKKRGRTSKKSVGQPVSQAPSMAQLQEEEDHSQPMDVDEPAVPAPAGPSRTSSALKPSVVVPPTPSSLQRRTSTGILSPSGRSATIEVVIPEKRRATFGGEVFESAHKRKMKAEQPAESGFSDYNPFQSGDDASPDGEKKKRRRKSSLGPSAGVPDENNPASGLGSMKRSSTMGALSSARKSLGNEGTSGTPSGSMKKSSSQHNLGSVARLKREFETPPVPPLPSAYTPSSAVSKPPKASLSSSKSVPAFQRYAAPFESMATPAEDFRLLVHEAEQNTASSSSKRSRRSDPSSALVMKPAAPVEVPELSEEDQQALEDLAAEPVLQGYSDAADAVDEDNVVVKSSRSPSPRKVSPPKQAQQRGPAPPSLNRIQSSDVAVVTPAKQEAAHAIAIRRVKPATPAIVQAMAIILPLLTVLAGYAPYWAQETRSLGFCDTETLSNNAVVARRGQFEHPGKPTFTGPDEGLKVDWPLLADDVMRAVTPVTCAPCPAHAECVDGAVKACKRDYILQPNAIAYLFGDGLDPSKSVTSVLFKPSCRPDTERLVRVAETASQIAKYLRAHRGDIVCGGEEKARKRSAKKDRTGTPEEWAVYGASEDFTRKVIKEVRSPKLAEEQFDEIFDEALQDLISHNEAVHGIDNEGEPWIAARIADMPLSCRTRLAAYQAADEHKASLAGLCGLLLSALYGKIKLDQKRRIKEQVDELVPVALNLLQQQDQNHSLDPTTFPYSYLAPSQLRDLVLQSEHSPSRRAELWKRVEKVVEGNSNVRAKVEEQYGEDIRVWQWVGGAYYIEEPDVDEPEESTSADKTRRKRKSYGGLGPRPSLSRPGTPRVNTPGRHITWSKDVKGSPVNTPM